MGMAVSASCSLSLKGGFTGCGIHAVLRGYLTMMHTKILLGLVREAGEEDWCCVEFQKRVFDEVGELHTPPPFLPLQSYSPPA